MSELLVGNRQRCGDVVMWLVVFLPKIQVVVSRDQFSYLTELSFRRFVAQDPPFSAYTRSTRLLYVV